MNESLELGAGVGTATGIAAIYAGHLGTGTQANFNEVAISAGIGTPPKLISCDPQLLVISPF